MEGNIKLQLTKQEASKIIEALLKLQMSTGVKDDELAELIACVSLAVLSSED